MLPSCPGLESGRIVRSQFQLTENVQFAFQSPSVIFNPGRVHARNETPLKLASVKNHQSFA